MNLSRVLGAVIYAERTSRSVSQSRLAEMAGLHPMSISKIERGVIADVGVETLQRLAGALNTSASSMLARAEEWFEDVAAEPDTLSGSELAATVLLIRSKNH